MLDAFVYKKYTKRFKKEWWSEKIRECKEASETGKSGVMNNLLYKNVQKV